MGTINSRPGPEEESARSVFDELMRGERVFLFPPGTFVASLFIPCLCIGVVPLGSQLTALILPSNSQNHSSEIAFSILGISVTLVALAVIGYLFMIQGYSISIVWLKRYVRALIFLAIILCNMVLLGWIDEHFIFCIVSLLALVGCHFIINSASMNFVAAFFAHKRKYQLERNQEIKKILGKKSR